jgi:hypothetical protein
VVGLAINTAGLRGFFERGDGEQSFDEDVEKFDEAAVFLNGSDEAVVLVAEMLLHELRGLPVDEFAFRGGGAALGFGSLGGNFLKMLLGVERSLGAKGGLDEGGWLVVRMRDGPFQDAMNDEVRITADGRSEVSVLIEAESEMAEGLGGVASLLEGTKHEVGDDALLGLAGQLLQQALIVFRGDVDVGAGKSDALLALAAVAPSFGTARLGG